MKTEKEAEPFGDFVKEYSDPFSQKCIAEFLDDLKEIDDSQDAFVSLFIQKREKWEARKE